MDNNDQIYIGCKIKILHGSCKGETAEVIDFSVEENCVDVLVDPNTKFILYLDFEDVQFID